MMLVAYSGNQQIPQKILTGSSDTAPNKEVFG